MPMLLPISHPSLWPTHCPACAYPLHGLPNPRCPECGEAIAYDEIILVGHLHRSTRTISTDNSWRSGALIILAIHLITFPIFLRTVGTTLVVLVVLSAGALLCLTLHTTVWLLHRRHGFPSGVLRLSASGYRFGAGKRIGVFHPWKPHTRIVCHFHRNGTLGLQALQMMGPIPLVSLFHLHLAITPEKLTQTILHLQTWQPHNVHVRQTSPRFFLPSRPDSHSNPHS